MKLPRFLRVSSILTALVSIEEDFRRQRKSGNFTIRVNFDANGRCQAVNVGVPELTFQVKEDLTESEIEA